MTVYKHLLAISLGLAAGLPSFSQIITIDKTDTSAYVKKAVWNGNISLGSEIDKQKTTLVDVSNFVDVSLQQYKELFIFSGSNRFTYNGSEDFLNAGYAHLRWRHNYKATWHPEIFVQYQWDEERGMVHRFVTGINARYNYWHSHLWELSLATGLMYENERWNYNAVDSGKIPINPIDQKSSVIKSNSYVRWEGKLSAVSNFSAVVFYQARFDDFLHPRVSGNLKFSIDISRHFAFAANFSGLYDAKPLVPIFNFYYNFSNSLVYKF